MADLYSEGRLKMTKNAFFATLSLNILRTASNNILKLGTVLDGMYIYHHAEFQVNRCNFEGARPFCSPVPNRKSALPSHAVACHVRCSHGIFKVKCCTCRWDQYLQFEGSNLKIAWKLSFFPSYTLTFSRLLRIFLACFESTCIFGCSRPNDFKFGMWLANDVFSSYAEFHVDTPTTTDMAEHRVRQDTSK